MKRQIEQMKREIERRGGILVGLSELPDVIVEQFLREVLACPCCGAAGRPHGESIDKLLAGRSGEDRTH